jgi:Flp pilus assembly protein TadD
MELTIEQALQQGVAAHKEGKLQEAERLYRAILQSQPKHADANHNLGVMAVSVNKADAALPLFKTALDANPKIEQFWLSYIDALIKEKQFGNAKEVIQQAKIQGVASDNLNALKARLAPIAQTENTDSASPPQEQLNSLLEHYQAGRYDDAEQLAVSITQEFPKHQFGWKVLGAVLGQTGRNSEAVHANRNAVALSPQDAEAHNNLGNTQQELDSLEEAEASLRLAITLKYNFAEAHYNLGNTLKERGRLEDAEASLRQAITLKPDYAEAHNNLGLTLNELDRLEEAEASYRQAIALKPDFTEAHNNLGTTLQGLGKLEEAEASYTQAIALKPDFAEALKQLGIFLYINGNIDSGIESLEKAYAIESKDKDLEMLLAVLKSRKSSEKSRVRVGDLGNPVNLAESIPNRLILNRVVEADLIATLYEMSSRELDKTTDARFGNGVCSLNFNLFEDTRPIIKNVAEDLTRIITLAIKSEIYIYDSFFNILGAGGGSTPHRHLNKLDMVKELNIANKKYSLVYYLSEGDQNCSEPGILKLYDPGEDILPHQGMITIIPATRQHSAVYGGKKDRVMIGVNFYSL